MLSAGSRGCSLYLGRLNSNRLRNLCPTRLHRFQSDLTLSMAQKSITAFFKGPEKRKGASESADGAEKRQKVILWPFNRFTDQQGSRHTLH